MTDHSTHSTLAASLTPAMREALVTSDGSFANLAFDDFKTAGALVSWGLVVSGKRRSGDPRYTQPLTPLGLALRDKLKGEE